MYLLAISSSVKTIDLSASYFVPDTLTKDALIDALKRGVNVYNAAFARRLTAVFEGDLTRARQITSAMWRNWPLMEKIAENAAAALSPQL